MKLEKTVKEDRKKKQLTYEYILPDYEGTLRRVMMTDAKVNPAERSLLREELVLSGTVVFSMLYQTVDDTLESIEFEVPYECSFHVDAQAEIHLDDVRLASYSCLPSGPRRVVAKAEIVACVRDITMSDVPSAIAGDSLMLLHEEHTFHTHLYSKKEEREYAEEIYSCEGDAPKVLYSDVTPEVHSCHPMKDGAVVSGSCRVRALLSDFGCGVHAVDGEIAFEEFLPMGESLAEKTPMLAEVNLVGFSLDIQQEEGVCHLVANPMLSFLVCATKENCAPLVADAYSIECEVTPTLEEITVHNEYPHIHHKQRLECRLPKKEGDPVPMRRIAFARSEGAVLECTPDDGVVYLMLKLSHSILGTDAPEADVPSEQTPAEEERPAFVFVRQRGESTHAINIPLPECNKECECRVCSLTLSMPEVYEEEDAFLLVCTVSFTLVSCLETTLPVVVGVERSSDNYTKENDTYFITFPDTGATLWQLAKENHASIPEILAHNPTLNCQGDALNSVQTLAGVPYILLP